MKPINEATTANPADVSATDDAPAADETRNEAKSRLPRIIGIAVLLGVGVWLVRIGSHAYHFVETEDAYITGHLHQVSPQISGQVSEVLVAENQSVQAGGVLVRLDAREFEIALQKAKAALEQAHAQEAVARSALVSAEAQISEAEARVAQAEAQVAQAAAQLTLSKLTVARAEKLYSNGGAITGAELDSTRSQFQTVEAGHAAGIANLAAARSGVVSAKAAHNTTRSQIAAASANVVATEAVVRDMERVLEFTEIKAPVAGRIGNKAVEIGNRVVAGQTLFSVVASEMWVVANFKETQLTYMEKGQEVELTVDLLPGRTLRGRIESLSPASGAQFALLPPDNSTGNFNKVVQRVPVKIALDQAVLADLGDRLRLGLSVVVNVRVR